MDKVFGAAAMIAAPFICLSILYCSSQLDHEFFHHSLNSIRVVTLLDPPCHWHLLLPIAPDIQCRFLREWLTTLQFPQGKEASGPRFGWTICCLGPGALRQLNRILLFSLPGGPKVIRICSHLRPHLEVGHHCLQSFWESSIKMIPLQFGYTIWGKTVWEGCCQYL